MLAAAGIAAIEVDMATPSGDVGTLDRIVAITAVPEPSSLGLLCAIGATLAGRRRRLSR